MHALNVLAVLAAALFANAEVYVTQPSAGSTFTGGKSVTVEWIDNGESPVLSDIGVVRVGLYTGDLQLVQTIVPVDVGTTHSLTFTPNVQAGPNSGNYYVAFISTSGSYIGYSPDFTLNGMSGSFSSPDPAATSSIPIPASLTSTGISAGGTSTGASGTSTGATSTSGASSASGTATAVPSVSSSASLSTSTLSTLLTTASGTSSTGSSSASRSSTGVSSSSTGTASSTLATATPTSAAVANGPAIGFAWTVIAFLGFALL